jgi:hypothetical protein
MGKDPNLELSGHREATLCLGDPLPAGLKKSESRDLGPLLALQHTVWHCGVTLGAITETGLT